MRNFAKTLAIIPARGGSKGLPRKNILPIGGHPLISYSIAAGFSSPLIGRVIVSTDDDEIAEIALKYGAEVPFKRPKDISGDFATDLETFQHALNWLQENEGYIPDLILQLRPTCPVRFIHEIEEGITKLHNNPEADSVRSVTPSPITPYKLWVMEDEAKPLKPFLTIPGMDESFNMPRQKLPTTYWHTGTYDIIRSKVLLEKNSMTGSTIFPLLVNPRLAVDIDDIQDFRRAESIILETDCIKPLH